MLDSEIRSVNSTVGPYLVVILLAWTRGYNLFGSKEVRLTEVYAVASSKRFARSCTVATGVNPGCRNYLASAWMATAYRTIQFTSSSPVFGTGIRANRSAMSAP